MQQYLCCIRSTPKEKLLNDCTNFKDCTSNQRDEKSVAQIRVSLLPVYIAAQRSGVPACSATDSIRLQSLSKACLAEPHPSLLLRSTTATSRRYIR
jgi:hypothetical protein